MANTFAATELHGTLPSADRAHSDDHILAVWTFTMRARCRGWSRPTGVLHPHLAPAPKLQDKRQRTSLPIDLRVEDHPFLFAIAQEPSWLSIVDLPDGGRACQRLKTTSQLADQPQIVVLRVTAWGLRSVTVRSPDHRPAPCRPPPSGLFFPLLDWEGPPPFEGRPNPHSPNGATLGLHERWSRLGPGLLDGRTTMGSDEPPVAIELRLGHLASVLGSVMTDRTPSTVESPQDRKLQLEIALLEDDFRSRQRERSPRALVLHYLVNLAKAIVATLSVVTIVLAVASYRDSNERDDAVRFAQLFGTLQNPTVPSEDVAIATMGELKARYRKPAYAFRVAIACLIYLGQPHEGLRWVHETATGTFISAVEQIEDKWELDIISSKWAIARDYAVQEMAEGKPPAYVTTNYQRVDQAIASARHRLTE